MPEALNHERDGTPRHFLAAAGVNWSIDRTSSRVQEPVRRKGNYDRKFLFDFDFLFYRSFISIAMGVLFFLYRRIHENLDGS